LHEVYGVKRQGLYMIGLTGNIATGKSAVGAMLAEYGAQVIDADALAHEVMKQGTATWQRVVDEFGQDVLSADGEVDRAWLGAVVFAKPEALRRLEAIVHPAVIVESERLLQEVQDTKSGDETSSATAAVVVLEAIKLIESGMHQRCDELWVVTTPREQQVQRLVATRGLSNEEAGLRIDAQPPQAEKAALADVVIDNSADLQQTQAQVAQEWQRIQDILRPEHAVAEDGAEGGSMSLWRRLLDEHPFLTMWAILAVGMVAIFLLTSRDVSLLPSQRLFMALACVALAGLCTWIVTWE
jgi:dephospho-CoA kinase